MRPSCVAAWQAVGRGAPPPLHFTKKERKEEEEVLISMQPLSFAWIRGYHTLVPFWRGGMQYPACPAEAMDISFNA
jgi:hypothetical protein